MHNPVLEVSHCLLTAEYVCLIVQDNWAKGHYTEGAELVESVVDVVRKEAGMNTALVFSSSF
jgi:hypothetical protein